jgi:tRNA (guanine-N7-)-methyltransferase
LSPGVSAAHAGLIAERRDRLRRQLLQLIPPRSAFVWEVGSGHGHFLSAYAAAHPERLFVGIDIASDRVARAKRKCDRARLGNLHFFLADDADFLSAIPDGAHFAEVFMLFPDPWPKRRHHKNRVMKPEFLTTVAARAGQGANLYFRTDDEPYYREAADIVRAHPDWTESEGAPLPFEERTVFQERAQRHFTLVAKRAWDKKSA